MRRCSQVRTGSSPFPKSSGGGWGAGGGTPPPRKAGGSRGPHAPQYSRTCTIVRSLAFLFTDSDICIEKYILFIIFCFCSPATTTPTSFSDASLFSGAYSQQPVPEKQGVWGGAARPPGIHWSPKNKVRKKNEGQCFFVTLMVLVVFVCDH